MASRTLKSAGQGDARGIQIFVTDQSLRAIDDLKLGFMETSDPRQFQAMLQLSTLNAAQKFKPAIKAEARKDHGAGLTPPDQRKPRTGRLEGAVAVRKARFNKPAAVVGIKAGRSRGDARGAWYRWFVVSGTSGVRTTIRTAPQGGQYSYTHRVAGIRANDFVADTVKRHDLQEQAVEAMRATIRAWLEGKIKYRGRRKR